MSQTRRLAAILAADVAGYSRLIGADEGATLQGLKAIRAELLDPKIAAHNGRLVKTTGDGLLVEFGSVVDALRCATEMQVGMAERNAMVPTDKRIEFRIGINVGDVVVEDGDIFGDSVNVAARLEGLAAPGGICVSARVQEDAAGRLVLAFEDTGEQALKNIARPVRVYRLKPLPEKKIQQTSLPTDCSPEQLSKTMSNPRYEDDLPRLDRHYERNAIIKRETTLVVVGKSVPAELLDRPVAELLRDHIDQRGGGKEYPYRRAIVLTDEGWYAEAEDLASNPVIAIGSPRANRLSEEFDKWVLPAKAHPVVPGSSTSSAG
jgi:class 3 adenylate cyclase